MISRKLIKKQPGRRWLTYVAGLGLLVGTLAVAGVALAVHDLVFQLDGDVSASTTTAVGGHTQTFDWDSFFNAAGAKSPVLPDASRPGFKASTFQKDFSNNGGTFLTSDASTYSTGSKDTLPITPGWQCGFSANVNSKIDIMNAYAVAYTDDRGTPATTDDHDILYFGLERNTNTGDGNVAFWFLQNAVSCSSPSGNAPFVGDHADGDLLIVSAFTNGGSVSNISVYRWNGGANGSLGTTAVASGGDCRTAGGSDTACAIVNTGTISTPWLTASKQDGVGHSLRISDAFEGGLDLTAANLSGKCFNTFTGDTRSSQSLTATLFDFALGTLGECNSTTTTQSSLTGANSIGAAASVSVSDTATVTVTGVPSFSGTVTFYLCGPSASSCSAATGTQIGSAQAITANGSKTSDIATVTEVGSYCWAAVFSGDATAKVPGSHDDGTNECFTVTPLTPDLATSAGAGPVDFGNPISDTATLTGTANHQGSGGGGTDGSINPTTAGGLAGGTITFTALGPDDCTTVAFTSSAVTVSGDGVYGPVSFTPLAPGTYHWVASYTGDSPNTNATSHNTGCTDTAEDVVVRQIPTSILTNQRVYPADSATVGASTGNLAAGGTVQFRLFDSATSCTNGAAQQTVGVGGLLYKESKPIAGGAPTETVSTANTTVSVTANSTVYWRVTYTPAAGDTAHTGRQSACSESTAITFVNDAGPGAIFP